ncbi:CRISPR-associated helicase Cas3' [Streptomyces zagrosensis]|uniref:CRISPR-associated endonuclease/helicase Cas3 n=1 Tax=Streptomyces zagrosensis TaxID=1042984 RepID=A0A7W9QA18_9ACTN|nr:CRISPR-associated helicase Cas3' [Streptomyces zagrosensis]MBB5936401.1 CRISPR-associated endonuclease/helicase Cas3 [Streptomyces zagrosensis]
MLHQILAKSARRGQPPEQLTAHLRAALNAADLVARRTGRMTAVADTVPQFWDAVRLADLLHDAGKIPQGCQHMLAGGPAWGERHEVLSLAFTHLVTDPDLRTWVAAGIATHHRPLTNSPRSLAALYATAPLEEWRTSFTPLDQTVTEALATWLYETANATGLPAQPLTTDTDWIAQAHAELETLLDRFEYGTDADQGLAAVLLQGAVVMADHLSSAHAHPQLVQPMNAAFATRLENSITAKGHTLRPHQQRAATTEGHLLLRSRTGSGKTEASWLWACRQTTTMQTRGQGIPRIFYTLPYLASINANADRTTQALGTTQHVGVAHGRAAAYHLATAACPEDGDEERVKAARKAVARQAATRLFKETIRITTPYQLLRAALVGPAHAPLLVDAANSVFIMDELHAYDTKRLGYILAMMGLLERLGGRFAILSATLPNALADLITDTLTTSVTRTDDSDSNPPPRHRIRTRPHHLTDPATVTEITQHLKHDEAVLVIANNIRQAQQLYDQLAPTARALHGPDAATMLHSRYKRHDRTRIEQHITGRYKVERTRTNQRLPGLVISTQVLEVSMDVDFDVLFTAAADLEALAQRFGRTNRIAAEPPADVIVHTSRYTPSHNTPGTWFADGIYPQAPTQAAWNILTAHDGQPIDENEITHWLNTIYTTPEGRPTPWGTTWRQEVLHHQDQFTATFLDFTYPYDDRTHLTERFDELFDGTEAILTKDRVHYATALQQAPGHAGRLLADDYLIPLPTSAIPRAHFDTELKVHIIDGDYTNEHGLTAIRHRDDT